MYTQYVSVDCPLLARKASLNSKVDRTLSTVQYMMIVLFQWVTDGSPSHSTPIKIESSNQFVPLNTNSKEFRKVQKMVSYISVPRGISESGFEDNIVPDPSL